MTEQNDRSYVTHGEFSEFKDLVNSKFNSLQDGINRLMNMVQSRGTNWGWLIAGASLLLALAAAWGTGLINPIKGDVAQNDDDIASLTAAVQNLVSLERDQAVSFARWQGGNDAAVSENTTELGYLWNIVLGRDGVTDGALITRLAKIETHLEDMDTELGRLRTFADATASSRFTNTRGIEVERTLAEQGARISALESLITQIAAEQRARSAKVYGTP